MNRTLPRLLFLFLAAQLTSAAAVDVSDTRLLKSPSISARHIAFAYDSDIWVAGRDGGAARRVTSAEGVELNPVLSPDGRWLAFTGNYDGNMDAYVMPAGGGEVRRLTWHPGNDMVVGFSGDSQRVLFYTPRSVHTNRHRHLYTVSVAGGPAERLPVPTGIRAALSPDGTRIAYTPHAPAFLQWKHYRGGRISRIWIMHLDDYDVMEVPMPDGGANNTDPMWIGDTLYFVSDRDGEFNLYRYADGAVVRLTEFDDFPVMNAKAGDGVIVFERAGQLHTFNPADGMVTTLAISAPSDLREARPRWVSGAEWVRSGHLAPDGNRVALEFRGEIVTVPADKGTPDVLSQSPGVHDRSPVWSPDGAEIAWFADEGGEYGLHMRQLETSETRRFEIEGAGFYFDPQWSPDSRYLAFRDNALALFLFDRESGRSTRIAAEPVYGPVITMTYRFSPDSRWLAYTLNTEGLTQAVHLHDLKSGRSRQITDGFAEVSEPTFGPDGDYLYMLASTEAGPVKDWFAQSNIDMMMQHHVYVATLAADGPDPLPPQEDEVAIQSEEAEDDAGADQEAEQKPTRVDFDGLDRRIRALPVPAATRHSLAVGEAGALFWIETKERTSFDAFNGPGELKRFTLKDREAKTVLGDVSAFELSADGKKILYLKQGKWFVTDAGEKLEEGKGQLKLDAVRVRIDPRAEWQQMFDEAWRINRDYFYADNYHGADWDAVKARYAPLVAHAATSADVMQLIRWMASELAVGHSYLGLGDTIEDPEEVSVGLLGADFVLDADGYRFERIYGGLNWAPELQAPLARPGVNVQEGDYLLAVDGEPVTINRSVFSYFENTVDRPVTLTVAASPRAASRSVEVVPTGSETQLRLRAWVKDNRQKVHEATDGRVAYVYVPNTTVAGHTYFKRDYYPQSHLPGIIVDERYNGGGLFADYYIDILRRPFAAWWAMRYGADLKSPRAATFGPKVMIADENAGSGGDLLPWMFKKYNLGPVVGTRTWGGLVGILGFPVLMDGGTVTAPNLAIWNDDGWIVENVGVPPDVEVRQWPKAVNAGGDPQLEKAIELALDGLKAVEENPPARPPFPTRALGPQQ